MSAANCYQYFSSANIRNVVLQVHTENIMDGNSNNEEVLTLLYTPQDKRKANSLTIVIYCRIAKEITGKRR